MNVKDYKKEQRSGKYFFEDRGNPTLVKEYIPGYFMGYKASGREISKGEIYRLENVYMIIESLINDGDEYLLNIMLEAYEKDISKLFDDMITQIYRILYTDNRSKAKSDLTYIKSVDDEVKQQMRYNSLCYFASDVLNMEINWHHLEWGWLVENFLMLCVLAARDHGKSFFFSHAYPLWMMFRYDRLNKSAKRLNGRLGYIFSNTMPQGVELLEIVKDSISDIPILREKLYPDYRETWSKTSIKCKNGTRVRVRSFGSSVRGAHPGYIIVDDAMKDNVLYSKLEREKNKDYFASVILNMLVPGGQLITVGTPFHTEDLYSLFKHSVDFAYREYPAYDNKKNLLWPKRHNQEDLDMRKRLMGNLRFSREFLCEPINDSSSMFPESILKRSIIGMEGFKYIANIQESKIKFMKVITGADFAKSANVGADYTCFVTFGIDESGNMFLLNMTHKIGMTFAEQKRELRRIWRNFNPDIMYLEANQFQSIYSEQLKDETDMPVVPFITDRKKHSLEEGVPSLSLLFENGKIHFPYGDSVSKEATDKILDEFRNIGWTDKGIQGVGSHDDIVMAIWIARMASIHGKSSFIFDIIGGESDLKEMEKEHNQQSFMNITGHF